MADKPFYAELEQQVRDLRGEITGLERAEKMNQTLYRVSSAVNTTENLEELYASIHKILHDVIELNNFYIAIYHREERSISFPYYRDGYEDDFSRIDDFEETNSLTGEVILNGEPVLLNRDMLAERAEKDQIIGALPLIWMGVPLKVKGEVIGVIATQSYTDPVRFSEADLVFLNSVFQENRNYSGICTRLSGGHLRRQQDPAGLS
jgi:transcriptional regulator with GAF, ATPase, and Fis domain